MGYRATPSPISYSPMTPGAPYTPATPGAAMDQGAGDWMVNGFFFRRAFESYLPFAKELIKFDISEKMSACQKHPGFQSIECVFCTFDVSLSACPSISPIMSLSFSLSIDLYIHLSIHRSLFIHSSPCYYTVRVRCKNK